MKIGIIAPPYNQVPPKTYGGTERFIECLVNGLVQKGHQVTLFAVKGSHTSAQLDCNWGKSLNFEKIAESKMLYSLKRVEYIISRSKDFDILHNNESLMPVALSKYLSCPIVTTVHSAFGKTYLGAKEEILKNANIIFISKMQKKLYDVNPNYSRVIYHGTTSPEEYPKTEGGDYLSWVGRFSPTKGPKTAIEVAGLAKHNIILAGKIAEENDYFETEIKPCIDNDKVKYIGEINTSQEIDLFRKSKVFLMPITWDEPFGLVMTESMACGLPVVAFNRGSVSEIVANGRTGYVIKEGDIGGMVKAVGDIYNMSPEDYQQMRSNCREHVMNNFSISQMVDNYESAYREVIKLVQK